MGVDLNIDLGELPGEPEELYALATVVNLACGGHTGDVDSMRHGVSLALRYGTRIAAHPSYPDREQFGRARMPIPPEMLYESIVDQVASLHQIAVEMGAVLWGAKLHGALYHAAAEDPQIAAAVLDGIVSACPDGVVIMGPPWGHLESASRARSLRYAREGFADRAYDEAGKLVPRGSAGDVLIDPAACADQALRLARSGTFDTLCVHCDGENPVAMAREVRAALERQALLRFEDPPQSDETSPSS
ncbi:MAG: LamB/YcsF family protein [Polyangiaceae bacterium]